MNCWMKKKTKKKFGLFDRLMLLSLILPPGYIIYRFVRWYCREESITDEEQ